MDVQVHVLEAGALGLYTPRTVMSIMRYEINKIMILLFAVLDFFIFFL
jgi:hypothetical protein